MPQTPADVIAAHDPTPALVGLLDDPESPVHKLVLKYRVALGLARSRPA
jgi:hypothetical protein